MSPRLSERLVWGASAALALVALLLLVRNILAIPAHVPLDPNEGWNAAHALAAMAGHGLYPPPQALMVNNYPPLSFYLIGAFARHGGDVLIAGRWVALAAFLATGAGIAAALRRMDCRPRAILLGALFFAALLLITSDYVGMDDPQLLGHAMQLGALLLLLRDRSFASALLFALSLFIKHNLLGDAAGGRPVAAGAGPPRGRCAFLLWWLAFALSGLVLFPARLRHQPDRAAGVTSPVLAGQSGRSGHTSVVGRAACCCAMAGVWPDRYSLFCLVLRRRRAAARAWSLPPATASTPTPSSILASPCRWALGLVVERGRWPILAAASALPLLMFLAVNFHGQQFLLHPAFRANLSPRHRLFEKPHRPGLVRPAFTVPLGRQRRGGGCLQCGRGDQGAASAIRRRWRRMIADHRFATLQLIDMDGLGADVRHAIEKNYRADHSDDNGSFLVPVRRAP